MFANFIFGVFLIVALLVFILLILLIRQIHKNGQLPSEKMAMLSAMLFIPALIIFGLVYLGIQNWRDDIADEKNRIELEQFTRTVYKPLLFSQQSLLRSRDDMSVLVRELDKLSDDHPNHGKLIQEVRQHWQKALLKISNHYDKNDKAIRQAWILQKTLNQKDVLDKFYKQAVILDKQNRQMDKQYQQGIRDVYRLVEKDLLAATRLISTRPDPNSPLNDKTINYFSQYARSTLFEYVNVLNPELSVQLLALTENQRIVGQKILRVREHLKDNPDLSQPLERILADWQNLQQQQAVSLKKILYAIESSFLATKLGISKKQHTANILIKQLNLRIPVMVKNALQQRELLENSYNIEFKP